MTDFPTASDIADANRNGLLGKPVDRVDGWAKVTGAAQYSYEIQEAGEPLVGVIAGATIAKGKILGIDTAAALASPGVVHVMTHENAPPQAPFCHPPDVGNRLWGSKPFLNTDEVRCYGDPIALVVADTFENARHAASLITATYEGAVAGLSFEDNLSAAYTPDNPTAKVDVGDFDVAFANAPVRLDETYTTPIHNHAQMEPHASLAVWEGERLTLFTACQLLKATQRSVAETLMMPRDNVRIVARYIGGGFGGKLHVCAGATLAALAAKVLDRPVKVQLTRQQMFAVSTHRTASRQRIRLGADTEGRLTAIAHEGVMHHARFFDFTEPVAAQTRPLYAAANRRFRHQTVALDIPMADAVRAPGEAIGMLAIEAAMDELAHRLGLDPIELRVRNEPTADPTSGKPYSSRSLVGCMREGAARFGWDRRSAAPGQVRDGRFLVGMGMAAAIRTNYLMPARATVGLNVEGIATIRQARRTYEPDPVWAAVEAQLGGADGITVHLREDRRHICDQDVERLKLTTQIKLNLEMAATDEMVGIACRLKPEMAMLVPEGRHEVTTEGGLDVAGQEARLKDVVARLADAGIVTSVFIDAELPQVEAAARIGAKVCEIHTGPYAHAFYNQGRDEESPAVLAELAKVRDAGEAIRGLGMRFNAGHALNYYNVQPIAALPGIKELHIGHAIVSRAVFVGLREAVREMKQLLLGAAGR